MQVNIKMLLFLVFCPVQIVTPYAKTAQSSTKICASILKSVMFPLMVCSNSIFWTKYILALKTPGNSSSEWYLDLKTKHGNYLNYDSFQTNLFFLIQLFWCWAYIECFLSQFWQFMKLWLMSLRWLRSQRQQFITNWRPRLVFLEMLRPLVSAVTQVTKQQSITNWRPRLVFLEMLRPLVSAVTQGTKQQSITNRSTRLGFLEKLRPGHKKYSLYIHIGIWIFFLKTQLKIMKFF